MFHFYVIVFLICRSVCMYLSGPIYCFIYFCGECFLSVKRFTFHNKPFGKAIYLQTTIMLWYPPVHVAFFHLLHFRKFQKKRKNEILVFGTDDVSFQSNYCRIAGACKI